MPQNVSYQATAQKILELIDSGVFPSGSRLPSLEESAQTFGVSRGGIREARIALEAQGHIELKGHSGAYVVDKKSIELKGAPNITLLELTEARALFEAEAAALAAPIITQETILELEKYVLIMSGSDNEEMTPDDADAAFHRAIARSTNNKMIIFVIESMWKTKTENADFRELNQKICNKYSAHRKHDHLEILQALKSRDPIAARAAVKSHFTALLQDLLKISEEQAYQDIQLKASKNRDRFLLSKKIAAQ